MKKHLALSVIVFLTAASLAFSNTLTFKINYFMPRLENSKLEYDFMRTEFTQMNFTKSNFQDTSFGIYYEYFLDGRFSLVFGIDTFSKSKAGFYLDYVGYQFDDGDFAFPNDYQGDYSPGHTLDFSVTPIQLSFKVAPLGRRANFIPYVGAGVGLYLWNLRMRGQLIDFSDPWIYDDPDYGEIDIYPIWSVDAREGLNFPKATFGYQLFGGAMFPIGNRLTLDAEFKFSHATGKLKDAFTGFEPNNLFDLGGIQVSIGLNYWF
jgi:opacity protein-like surface antigen